MRRLEALAPVDLAARLPDPSVVARGDHSAVAATVSAADTLLLVAVEAENLTAAKPNTKEGGAFHCETSRLYLITTSKRSRLR